MPHKAKSGRTPNTNRGRSSGSMMGIGWFVLIVVVLGVLLFIGIFLALDALPAGTLNTDKKDWYELVQTTIVILGVLAGSVAAAISYRSQRIKEKELFVQEDGRFTDRFTRAIEQLGNNDSIAVRIGGVYALDRLAHDSPADRQRIVDVMTSRIREQAPDLETVSSSSLRKLPEDITAIIKVLKRLSTLYRDIDIVLTGANLNGADLTWANLTGANLNGVNLTGAHLNGANLTGARLNRAKLRGTNLIGANLTGAPLSGAKLIRANLNGANLRSAVLRAANLTGAKYDTNILEAIWDENTIFSNGQKGTPDVKPDTPNTN